MYLFVRFKGRCLAVAGYPRNCSPQRHAPIILGYSMSIPLYMHTYWAYIREHAVAEAQRVAISPAPSLVTLSALQQVTRLCRSHTILKMASLDTSILFIFMAALRNRAGHYIFVLWFLLSSSFFLSFFLAYSQPSQIGCLPYFHI